MRSKETQRGAGVGGGEGALSRSASVVCEITGR